MSGHFALMSFAQMSLRANVTKPRRSNEPFYTVDAQVVVRQVPLQLQPAVLQRRRLHRGCPREEPGANVATLFLTKTTNKLGRLFLATISSLKDGLLNCRFLQISKILD
jgi:hypothetical protein